jgi:hypothetical protein
MRRKRKKKKIDFLFSFNRTGFNLKIYVLNNEEDLGNQKNFESSDCFSFVGISLIDNKYQSNAEQNA